MCDSQKDSGEIPLFELCAQVKQLFHIENQKRIWYDLLLPSLWNKNSTVYCSAAIFTHIYIGWNSNDTVCNRKVPSVWCSHMTLVSTLATEELGSRLWSWLNHQKAAYHVKQLTWRVKKSLAPP